MRNPPAQGIAAAMSTPRPLKLSPDALATFLEARPAWRVEGDTLVRAYELPSFAAGIAFLVSIGFAAEKLDHHPDLALAYKTVTVTLTTHDANGLTGLDTRLAELVDGLFANAR